MILSQALNQAALRDPAHPAVQERGSSVSYGELRERVGRLSNFYQAELPHGAVVALLARNGAHFAQSLFALSNTGNPVYPVDPRETDESVITDLRNLKAKAVLVSAEHASRVAELVRREKLGVKIFEIEKRRAGEYDTGFHPLPDRPLRESDPVLVLRSDEPGERRYCVFTHAQVHGSCASVKRFYRLQPSDRMLTTMSWSHPFALSHGLLLPLFGGATCVVDPEPMSVEEFVKQLANSGVTRFAGPPKFYFQLLSHCAAHKYKLPGVKSITIGMGSISLALRKTYKLLRIPVLRCYGRPEAVWSLAMDDLDEALDVETARMHPVTGARLEVLSEDGEAIPGPDRREGRLAVMSPHLCEGYFHPDEKTGERLSRDRFHGTWLRTGEVARLEGEGDSARVAVLGKLHDMLLVEGLYQSPRRIDDAARKVEGVIEAAGFVRFGKDRKPAFAAALVMKSRKVNEKDLLTRLQEDLPDDLHPQSIHFVSSLPRDAFDSVNRLALQKQFSVS